MDPISQAQPAALERTLVEQLREHLGERVRVRGWAQAIRDQKSVQFVIVRDETGLVQVVSPKSDPPSALNETVSALSAESAVSVIGTIVEDGRVKLGGSSCAWRSSTSTRSPSPSSPSRPSRRSTSAWTGATSTCVAPIAG